MKHYWLSLRIVMLWCAVCSFWGVVNEATAADPGGVKINVRNEVMYDSGEVGNTFSGDYWEAIATAPVVGAYGETWVSDGEYLYLLHCMYATSPVYFYRYDPRNDEWEHLSTAGVRSGTFRNGTAGTWDWDEYFYFLGGARYSDPDERTFMRYNIPDDSWDQMPDTLSAQGAGDAITWSGYDGLIYALTGSSSHEGAFSCFYPDTEEWEARTPPPHGFDDGCSLVWTGDDSLYAMRGEYIETSPLRDVWRYSIPEDAWYDETPIPVSGGVGDGGTMIWVGGWIPKYDNYIFATSGGNCWEVLGDFFGSYNIVTHEWTELDPLLCPIGFFNGARIAFAQNYIFSYQGTESDTPCGGAQVSQYTFSDVMPSLSPDVTPIPSSPTPTPTATQIPPELGVELYLSSELFHPGDSFFLRAVIHDSEALLTNQPFVVVLDLHGQYFWYPDWTNIIECTYVTLTQPSLTVPILLFDFPAIDYSDSDITIYAALTDAEFSTILGSWDSVTFGWEP